MIRTLGLCLISTALFLVLTQVQDSGYAGPHHDEVIALLASKGLEGDFEHRKVEGQPPFGMVVPADSWHQFTQDFNPVSFRTIRDDMQSMDRHPPLAFWLFNRWLSLFSDAGYRAALWLTRLLVILGGAVLAFLVWHLTGTLHRASVAFALFLAGNGAVFTASWVRQYALYTLLFGLTLLFALELVRLDITRRRFLLAAVAIGMVAAAGMMTQYAYLTVSGPLHATLILVFAFRSQWRRVLLMAITYALAGALFLMLLPAAVHHARAVSRDLAEGGSWLEASSGIAKTVIPIPSATPEWVVAIAGALIFSLAVLAGFLLLRVPSDTTGQGTAALILAGFLGTGLVQIVLVATGVYPGWATGPNHMGPFWMLLVLASVLLAPALPRRVPVRLASLALLCLMSVQILYTAHLHRIRPNTNAAYVARLQPDLVYMDSPDRGMVLELTDTMAPEQPVLVTDDAKLGELIRGSELAAFDRILYLKMPSSRETPGRVESVLCTFQGGGWKATSLPVVNPGLFGAFSLERN